MAKKFLLLNEIDEQLNAENLRWNENAFQTLLTSNLPAPTIAFYAIDVALRRLETSLTENFWDVTADALHDLSQYLFNVPLTDELQPYLYEAKCQLFLFASIALLKLYRLRHRTTNEAKLSCATNFFLLLEQSQKFEMNSNHGEFSSCIRSMRRRYYKRIFLTALWLPTLSDEQFRTIENHHEKHIHLFLEQLFPVKAIRDRLNDFIEYSLIQNEPNSHEATSNGFVFVSRFPRFHRRNLAKHADAMHIVLTNTLQQNPTRLFVYSLWTLATMIEGDRLELGVLTNLLQRDHFASTPIDFEDRPLTINSLHSCDVIVFLLLCAQQHVRTGAEESILNPSLLYSATNLWTKTQQNWWSAALQNKSSTEFLKILSLIRLGDEVRTTFPPIPILLRTAEFLFKAAKKNYEQYSSSVASSYEQYAIQYLQTVKKLLRDQNESNATKTDQPFFSFPTSTSAQLDLQTRIDECEQLARQCDELKLLPSPASPRQADNPAEDDESSFVPVQIEPEQPVPPTTLQNSEPIPKTITQCRDIDVQTTDSLLRSSSPPPVPPSVVEPPAPAPVLPPFVGMIFSHMNGVNQWINRHCLTNEGIQNDIHAIRDRLEKLNRATSQMIYDNVKPNQHEDPLNQ